MEMGHQNHENKNQAGLSALERCGRVGSMRWNHKPAQWSTVNKMALLRLSCHLATTRHSKPAQKCPQLGALTQLRQWTIQGKVFFVDIDVDKTENVSNQFDKRLIDSP